MNVSKTARELPKNIQKALIDDIHKIVKYISVNFDVYKRGTQQLTGETQLLEQVLAELMIEEPICAAITKSGTKCIRKAQAESRYCRQHALKAFTNNYNTPLQAIQTQASPLDASYLTLIESNQENQSPAGDSLKKQFIEDSFYWVDSQYIYDLNNYHKVGYIDSQTNAKSPEFVLTDDPFLLN